VSNETDVATDLVGYLLNQIAKLEDENAANKSANLRTVLENANLKRKLEAAQAAVKGKTPGNAPSDEEHRDFIEKHIKDLTFINAHAGEYTRTLVIGNIRGFAWAYREHFHGNEPLDTRTATFADWNSPVLEAANRVDRSGPNKYAADQVAGSSDPTTSAGSAIC